MQTHPHHVLGTADVARLARSPATTHDDSELLRLIAEFVRLERAADAMWATKPPLSGQEVSDLAECKALYAAQRPLFDRIMELRATTLEGFKARARMLFVWYKELEAECHDEGGCWPEKMRWALISDLIGEDRS